MVNLLIRVLWFILIGWWLGLFVSAIAWLLIITIIGLPLGLYIVNRLPTIITLRPQEQGWHIDEHGVMRPGPRQFPFWARAVWFILVGWWLNGIWMALSYLALVTIIGLPLAFWMYGQIGAVTTLHRS